MGTGVAVAADNQATRQTEAQLWADDMDDALAGLVDVEQPNAGGGGFDP
jgi:hypothetical protein